MSCHAEMPETHRQKCIRQWETAKKVFAALEASGVIPKCNTNQAQIELYKNLVCRINADGEIKYGFGLRFYGEKNEIEKKLGI